MRTIYPNVTQCLNCRKVLVSNSRHDFVSCGCSNQTFVDGGYDYLRCGGVKIEMVKVLKLSSLTPQKKKGKKS